MMTSVSFRTMNSSEPMALSSGLDPPEVGMEITVVLPLFLSTICLVGLVGNLFLIAILIHDFRKGKCSVVNCLVINLGITDLLLILFCIPVRIVTYAKQSWLFGSFVCKTTGWFLQSCLTVKSLTLAAIGQARYKHVITPPKFLSFSKRHVVVVLLFTWSLSLLLPLPHLILTQVRMTQEGLTCSFDVPEHASNFMNVFSKLYPLLAYVLPMVFTFFCYMRALRRKERRNRVPNPRVQSRKITSMLMSMSLAFEAMWLPEWIVWIWARHTNYGILQPPNTLMVLAQVILFLNSTLNPGVFLAVSEEFRDGFKTIWTLMKCEKCQDGGGASRAGENGADMVPSTIQSLQDFQCPLSAHRLSQDSKSEEKVLPDVEHFWQDRRNTTAGEDNDPMPWEHQEKP
ncbi:PREDICTED: probable G-protein coupled receptor 151 [Nanorana parkeri]|uniref:probable G-protein coupled receptor 151 n=1 Tax=Nanorana parkeri TaxID=125878 RepID=UPI000854F094|nr:PREDICTED: probable G-protein coupled receptor 151 [Nanorana parkeri]